MQNLVLRSGDYRNKKPLKRSLVMSSSTWQHRWPIFIWIYLEQYSPKGTNDVTQSICPEMILPLSTETCPMRPSLESAVESENPTAELGKKKPPPRNSCLNNRDGFFYTSLTKSLVWGPRVSRQKSMSGFFHSKMIEGQKNIFKSYF